jgi:hypothetical protein
MTSAGIERGRRLNKQEQKFMLLVNRVWALYTNSEGWITNDDLVEFAHLADELHMKYRVGW